MLTTTTCEYSNPVGVDRDGNLIPVFGTNNFQFKNSLCTTINSNSTSSAIYNGFTAGEIVISLFLFWIFCFLIFSFIVKFIGFFKTK